MFISAGCHAKIVLINEQHDVMIRDQYIIKLSIFVLQNKILSHSTVKSNFTSGAM